LLQQVVVQLVELASQRQPLVARPWSVMRSQEAWNMHLRVQQTVTLAAVRHASSVEKEFSTYTVYRLHPQGGSDIFPSSILLIVPL